MAQNYTINCYDINEVTNTNMTQIENNFEALRTKFSASSSPSPPIAGQWWADTSGSPYILKIRNGSNSSWVNVYDYTNGKVIIDSTIRQPSLISGEAITPSSCSLKTAAQLGGALPVNYRQPSSSQGYSFATGSEADIVGLSTQANVVAGQLLVARAEITVSSGTVPTAYIRFNIGGVNSTLSSGITTGTSWTGTLSATVSGNGWQTLKWRGYVSGSGTAYVRANSLSLG